LSPSFEEFEFSSRLEFLSSDEDISDSADEFVLLLAAAAFKMSEKLGIEFFFGRPFGFVGAFWLPSFKTYLNESI